MTEQESTAFLDSRMFTHMVDSQQPIEYGIEGLNMNNHTQSRASETTQQTQNTFKL